MLSEEESINLANNVIAMSSANLASLSVTSEIVYPDDKEMQGILMYMSVLMTKMGLEDHIDSVEWQMQCLDVVKEIYAKIQK